MLYLVHVISAEGLSTDPEKITAVQGYINHRPEKKSCRFWGLSGIIETLFKLSLKSLLH
jgi:hypothetical protein